MTFSEQLNEYLSILNCSAKELSQISGLSNSVISRYRSGERVPRPESEKLNQLCEGIYLLSKEKEFLVHVDVFWQWGWQFQL